MEERWEKETATVECATDGGNIGPTEDWSGSASEPHLDRGCPVSEAWSAAWSDACNVQPPDARFFPILERESRGALSAYDAACEIQDLGPPGFHDPSASEVVLWSRMAGFGIPTPSEDEARAEAEAILARLASRRELWAERSEAGHAT